MTVVKPAFAAEVVVCVRAHLRCACGALEAQPAWSA
jgi:hypothetical protein